MAEVTDVGMFVTDVTSDNIRLRKEVEDLKAQAWKLESEKSQRERKLEWAVYCMCKAAGGLVEIGSEIETRDYLAGREERLFIEWEDYNRRLRRVRISTVDEIKQYGVRVVHPEGE